MSEEKRIIEVNGVKLEVDLREAKNVESYKVGDPVRVLKKQWDKNWKVYSGVILGFDSFQNAPTIVVGMIGTDGKMEYLALNKFTKDFEIAPMNAISGMLEKDQILDKMDRTIEKCEEELRTARRQRFVFLKYFRKYFADYVEEIGTGEEEKTA